jgi:hypothetical protein
VGRAATVGREPPLQEQTMLRSLTVGLVVVLASTLTATAARADSRTFSPKDGGFEIKVPAEPRQSTKSFDTLLGKATLKLFSGKINDMVFYTAGYTEFPKGLTGLGSTKDLLDGGVAGSAKGVNGKVISQKTIKLGNVEGREAVIEALNGKLEIRVRVFVVKDRMYQVMTATAKANGGATEITDFLDSFKLTDK